MSWKMYSAAPGGTCCTPCWQNTGIIHATGTKFCRPLLRPLDKIGLRPTCNAFCDTYAGIHTGIMQLSSISIQCRLTSSLSEELREESWSPAATFTSDSADKLVMSQAARSSESCSMNNANRSCRQPNKLGRRSRNFLPSPSLRVKKPVSGK